MDILVFQKLVRFSVSRLQTFFPNSKPKIDSTFLIVGKVIIWNCFPSV